MAAVFRLGQEPWIDPNGAEAAAIIDIVRRCPSGAFSYSIGGIEQCDREREPTITISKNGPYRITGGIAPLNASWSKGASQEHYALCRCGGSKNKPFCDGSHWYNGFKDDTN